MRKLHIFFSFLIFSINLFAQNNENVDVIVAKDGSGNYLTIQEALNVAPENSLKPFKILIKNGIYNEKIYIEKNNLILIGENIDSTIIQFAELRSEWRKTHINDWGAATINVRDTIHDLTFANLTVKNNFAELNPKHPTKTDHSFAIRGGGNRVIMINCKVISTGGDACSFWAHGFYYHRDCYFEGYVDFLCPRGWCYIIDCQLYGYNTHASVWLDGRKDKDEKFVLKNCYFDGVKGFGLGRFHKDAQFYFIECKLSERVNNNGGVLYVGKKDSLFFGNRVYYYNTHREGGDYSWHKNNLETAEGNPHVENITPSWVFQKKWEPESKLGGILPFAYLPFPENNSTSSINLEIRWFSGRNAISHNLYLGTDSKLKFLTNQKQNSYELTDLKPKTTYYWRIDEVTPNGIVPGKLWNFTTQ